MFSTGIMMMPKGPIENVVAVAQAAEDAGYDFCIVADEGFMYDAHVVMTLIVTNTKALRVAPITNPYSRHPAVTAAALASLNTLAPGRAFLGIVAGGSLVLGPMRLKAAKPVSACRDMIQITRALLSGEKRDVDGVVHGLAGAQLEIPAQPVDIWLLGRGPKMMRLAGEAADITVVTGKMGTGAGLEQARTGAIAAGRELRLAYLGTLGFNEQIRDQMRPSYTYVIPDSPPTVWDELGVSAEWVAQLKQVRESEGADAAKHLISDGILNHFIVSGSREECVAEVRQLVRDWRYQHFILPVMSLDLDYAVPLIQEAAEIYTLAR